MGSFLEPGKWPPQKFLGFMGFSGSLWDLFRGVYGIFSVEKTGFLL